jgi:trimeric autotransporter adhesin
MNTNLWKRNGVVAVFFATSLWLTPILPAATFSDADWVSLNPGIPGANSDVRAIAVDSSGTVYVGGFFTFIGTVAANCIAKWDGNRWSALGSGMNGGVSALAVSGTNLYAGGSFTNAGGVLANNIAKWDGATWSALGSGINGDVVVALAISGAHLYAGGLFYDAGGVAATNIAKWDGVNWSALGSGTDAMVYALAVSGADLYAGGTFITAGGVTVNTVARWDGSAWSALGSGMSLIWPGSVRALAVSGTNLYAGGDFWTAGGVPANYIAKWDGSAWSALASEVNYVVHALAVGGTDLYAGGEFITAGGTSAYGVAKWDGSAWSALGSGVSGSVWALAVTGSTVIVGGESSLYAGGTRAYGIARWDSATWSAFGSEMNDSVQALAAIGTDLYAAGYFTTAGGVEAHHIAKWDGDSWSALSSGVNGTVEALAVSGTALYAGGSFTLAGGVPASRVAKWNGLAWSSLGDGIGQAPPSSIPHVTTMVVSGSDLYVGGWFTNAGGVPANNIAKWNGSAWSALGRGIEPYPNYTPRVWALAASGTNLFAGGYFYLPLVGALSIAKWDGNQWSALGSGISGRTWIGADQIPVMALAASGTDLYAAGWFTNADGVLVSNIAKWDGSVWSALGSGVSGYDAFANIRALAISGTNLYAGGDFSFAGGSPANSIAKCNGGAWSPLGSGVSVFAGGVLALATDTAGHLFLGGGFYSAGTNVSPFVVQANIGPCPGRLGTATFSPSNGVSLSFYQGKNGQDYRIQTSPSLAPGSWTDLTNFTYSGPTAINDSAAISAPKKFYRAVSP